MFTLFALLAAFVASSPPGGDACRAAQAAAAARNLVVHEWGTFTSVQGSDGIALEGLQHEEEQPAAVRVLALRRCASVRSATAATRDSRSTSSNVTQKMETPVIYFHSPEPLRAAAARRLREGPALAVVPGERSPRSARGRESRRRTARPLAKIESSFLEWEVDVLAPGEGERDLPAVPKGSPLVLAATSGLESRAHACRGRPADRPGRDGEVPLLPRRRTLRTSDDRARTEAGSRIVRLERGEGGRPGALRPARRGGRGQFDYVNGLAAGEELKISRPISRGRARSGRDGRDLVPALVAKLVERGLYADEAEAMARTWERSYFRTDGLRVLYVVPDGMTRAILPLRWSPPRSRSSACSSAVSSASVRSRRNSFARRSSIASRTIPVRAMLPKSVSRVSVGFSSRTCAARSRSSTIERWSRVPRACSRDSENAYGQTVNSSASE